MISTTVVINRLCMKSDTIVTFTDSNICTIAIGKAITFNIEMYQGDTKIMESNNNITLNVSTIIIKTGILYSKVDRHYAFNKTYMTCDSVNFTVYNKRSSIYMPDTGIKLVLPIGSILTIPTGCIIKPGVVENLISKDLSILSQSQIIASYLQNIVKTDPYKSSANIEIRKKIIQFAEQSSLQVEEIFNMVRTPTKLELILLNNIRETISEMRAEIDSQIMPSSAIVANNTTVDTKDTVIEIPDSETGISNAAVSNTAIVTPDVSVTSTTQEIELKEPSCKKRKLDRL